METPQEELTMEWFQKGLTLKGDPGGLGLIYPDTPSKPTFF